jgi:hypothetical protein
MKGTGLAILLVLITLTSFLLLMDDWSRERSGSFAAAFATSFDLWVWLTIGVFGFYLIASHYEYLTQNKEIEYQDFNRFMMWTMTVGLLLFGYVYSASTAAKEKTTILTAFLNELLFDDALKACEAIVSDDGKRFQFRGAKSNRLAGVVGSGTNRFTGQPDVSYVLYADDRTCKYDPLSKSAEISFGPDHH